MSLKVYVIYGQGGKGPLSAGFILFRNRLTGLGYDVVDSFLWKHPDAIIEDIHNLPKKTKVALLGYSMGANCTTWVASAGQKIDLICAYDPSVWSYVNPIEKNVKRTICYSQNYDLFGRVKLEGYNVENIITAIPHIGISYAENLHKISLEALSEIEGE